ncbi:portal protein [Paenibacillus urinalis]|uniref:portal protein n=1 Tax=Paenibacillus urinalis TaxID=521520 RepID=UPI00196100A3
MEQKKSLDNLASEIDQQYEEGLSYKRRMGFLAKWPMYERFKAGDQWPAAVPQTQNLPRPVFNIIKMIETHKVANVMSEQIKMIFSRQEIDDMTAEEEDVGDLFSRFSEATWERLKQDELNEEGLDVAANTGTGIWHYVWDNSIAGGELFPYQGEMQGEILDPINVFFGNPQQRNVQKQPYILISSREPVKNVRAYARANKMSKEMTMQIKPDKDVQDEGYDAAKVELNDKGKVTVLTRYWKANGKVMFCKVAAGMTIKPATDTELTLYPIAVMQWERRKKSIFGVGDTEGLIPNQKAVNLLVAMQILSVQLTGWPKLVYKSNAIDPWKVTNAPGEMIEDRSPVGQGDGVKYLTPGTINAQAANLVEAILAYTRQMTGADEAATGSAPSADLNATAIMLLQKAAAIPIESIKRRFYRLIEDIGRIWEDFWKVKYNIERQVMLKDDEGETYPEMFNGSQYQGVELNLKIDVGPSSTYSEALMVSTLEKAKAEGDITFAQLLKYMPKSIVPYRDRLLKELDEQKGVIALMEEQFNSMPPDQKETFAQLPVEQQFMMLQNAIAPPQPETLPMGAPPIPMGV